MTYEQALQEVNGRLIFGSKPGLKRMTEALELLGNPQKNLKFIHVAGTNGKGTTCTYMAYALHAAGYRTGLYTSPYVVDFRERFQMNGEMISKQELAEQVESVAQKTSHMKEPLTEFEFITVLAFQWFAEKHCDIVVLEVGLGGRFDATNVIDLPEMAVITSISLDHTANLGDTVDKIAFEKGGIIKLGGKTVLYPVQKAAAREMIEKLCTEKNSELISVNTDEIEVLGETLLGTRAKYGSLVLELPFSGHHQVLNAATALAALKHLDNFPIADSDLQRGFKAARIAARMELLSEAPLVLLDGGHNPGCAEALKALLEKHANGRRITAIIGMMRDKDSKTYLQMVAPLFSSIVTVSPQGTRSMPAEELRTEAMAFCPNCRAAHSMEEAVEIAFCQREEALVICGSFFLAGEIRQLVKEKIETLS